MDAVLAVALLIGVLAFATVRPRRLPEAVAAVPAAAILVATGGVSWTQARADLVVGGCSRWSSASPRPPPRCPAWTPPSSC